MITGAENTSFIPKKSPTSNRPVKKSLDLIFLITFVIFLLTILFSMGVFMYKSFLTKSIEESKLMLEREKSNFDVDSIRELVRLDNRLSIAEVLLEDHLDLTGLFEVLQKDTLKAVQFENFEFEVTSEGLNVLMDGITDDYATVALQADIFGNNPLIKNTIFSDLDVNNDGEVIFSFSATLDKDLVSYKKRVE